MSQQRSNEGGYKRKRGAPINPKEDTTEMLTEWNTNKMAIVRRLQLGTL
jgi:hypothetical protein